MTAAARPVGMNSELGDLRPSVPLQGHDADRTFVVPAKAATGLEATERWISIR